MASRPQAGCELLGFKHAFYPGDAVVPAGNGPGLQFLIEHGAEETEVDQQLADEAVERRQRRDGHRAQHANWKRQTAPFSPTVNAWG